MNLYSYKARIISLIVLSFSLMVETYGDFSEDVCFGTPPRLCGEFLFEVDFLILRPYEKMSNSCAFNQITNTVGTDGNVLTTLENRNKYNNFQWWPAFRITAGYAQNESNWKYAFSWMHFNSNSHTGGENSRKWSLNFDTLDAIVDYTFYGNACFSITSFGGIRGAKIDQTLHLTTVFENPIRNRDEQKFWGVGPVIGFETNCKMRSNLSLYANVAFSWLYGMHEIKLRDLSLFDTGSTSFQGRNRFFANQLVSDAGIGVQWDTLFCDHKMFFRLGFEHHHYFDYNYFENSDLSLSGANISAGIEF